MRKIFQFLCGTGENTINRTNFWTMVSSLSTVLLLGIGYHQLAEVNTTTHAQFSHDIKSDLFTEPNINLVTLFGEDDLILDTINADGNGLFDLDTVRYKKLHPGTSLNHVSLSYQSYQVDALLQNFEDLGIYEQKGLMDMDFINEGYGSFIKELWESSAIQQYIKWLRTAPDYAKSYIYFEYIYKKVSKR